MNDDQKAKQKEVWRQKKAEQRQRLKVKKQIEKERKLKQPKPKRGRPAQPKTLAERDAERAYWLEELRDDIILDQVVQIKEE